MRRDCSGQSTVELAIGLPILLGVILGALALFMGEQARTAVIDAARAGARLAAIECGNNVSTWQSDSIAFVQQSLGQGGLAVGSFTSPAASNPSGSWYAAVTCTGGQASVTVYYNEINLFPPLADLIQSGSGPGAATFWLSTTVVFPVE